MSEIRQPQTIRAGVPKERPTRPTDDVMYGACPSCRAIIKWTIGERFYVQRVITRGGGIQKVGVEFEWGSERAMCSTVGCEDDVRLYYESTVGGQIIANVAKGVAGAETELRDLFEATAIVPSPAIRRLNAKACISNAFLLAPEGAEGG